MADTLNTFFENAVTSLSIPQIDHLLTDLVTSLGIPQGDHLLTDLVILMILSKKL